MGFSSEWCFCQINIISLSLSLQMRIYIWKQFSEDCQLWLVDVENELTSKALR